MKSKKTHTMEGLAGAGELLAVEAIDHAGLIVTSEGALVRIIAVTPPNPLILSQEEREQTAAAFCQLVSRLRPQRSVQFYVEARPVNLGEVLADCRTQVEAWSGEPPARGRGARDDLALSRWRLYAAMEQSLREHTDDQPAMQLAAYVVVPYLPGAQSARAIIEQFRPGRRLPVASLERELKAHRRAARESLAHTDAIRSELEALNLPTHALNGEQVVSLLWSRFNPTRADRGKKPPAAATEILGELDTPVDLQDARNAAMRLRELVAQSPLDFKRHDDCAVVDRDLEQTLYTSTTADATYMGWLMRAMMTRQPFTLSVFVHALNRHRERTRVKMDYPAHVRALAWRGVPGTRAGLRHVRQGARAGAPARRDGRPRASQPLSRLDLSVDPRSGTPTGRRHAVGGRGLLP